MPVLLDEQQILIAHRATTRRPPRRRDRRRVAPRRSVLSSARGEIPVAKHCCTAAHKARQAMIWSGMVDAGRPLRVCSASSRTAAIEQSEWLLQLVSDRRRRAGTWRGSIDPADGRNDGVGPWRRPCPGVCYRPLGWRRDDFSHARNLSGSVRGRRDYRRTPVWRGNECAAGLREHVSMSAARSLRLGRSGTPGVFAQRAVAARFCIAWRCRRDRHSIQRG